MSKGLNDKQSCNMQQKHNDSQTLLKINKPKNERISCLRFQCLIYWSRELKQIKNYTGHTRELK